jgi:hypothetical protein
MGGSTGIMYNTKCAKTTQERRMQNFNLNVHYGGIERKKEKKKKHRSSMSYNGSATRRSKEQTSASEQPALRQEQIFTDHSQPPYLHP